MGKKTYHGVTVNRRLTADEQRSLAMRLRNFGLKYGVKISESVTPIEEPTPITRARSARPTRSEGISERARQARAQVERDARKAGISSPKAKATKRNDFYEDVIVGKREERAARKPHKCKVKSCYKYGRRFSDTGWFGDGVNKGHIQISAAHR